MPQLDPSSFSSQLFWLAIFFITLYLVLSRALLPRVKTVLAHRANTISTDLDGAETSKSKAEEVRGAYEKSLADMRAKSKAMIAKTREESSERAAKQQAETDAALEKQVSASEAGIEKATKDVMDKLAPVASELASEIVKLLVSRTPDAKEIDAALRKLKGGAA